MEQKAWRILIVGGDRRLTKLTRGHLEGNGLKADIEASGAPVAACILAGRPGLVALDLILPGEDGPPIRRQVRPQFDDPTLMLTACADDMDEVLGLEMGADGYVCKPVHPRVLLVRTRTLLRRSEAPEVGAPTTDSKRLAFGRLVTDNAMCEAWLDGTTIELTSAESDLFWLLAANARRILSCGGIFNALRGVEYDGQNRPIDMRISRIRPKVGDDPMHPRPVKTMHNKGYLFVGEG